MPLNGSSSSSTARVVHQRGGHLDPLPHPLGVRRDRAVLRVGHLDLRDRPLGRRAGVGQPVQLGVGDDELAAGQVVEHRLPLGHQADACGRPASLRHSGSPSSVTVPVEGRGSPTSSRSAWILPAPFGPSRPVTPGPIVIDTSLTATTLRYHRETWSMLIVAHGSDRPVAGERAADRSRAAISSDHQDVEDDAITAPASGGVTVAVGGVEQEDLHPVDQRVRREQPRDLADGVVADAGRDALDGRRRRCS